MGFPDGLTCIVSPTGNRTRDGRHDSAGVGPLHQKFGFLGLLQVSNIPEPYRGFEPRTSCLLGDTSDQLH
jgi:hypothetical protein